MVGVVARRFLVFPALVTLLAWLRFRAFVSPRAEVELSPLLSLGRKVKVSSFTKIKASYGPLRIGDHTSIATGCFIGSGKNGTSIGRRCLIGPNCTIVSSSYRYDKLDVPFALQGQDSKGTSIGDNVLIGAGSVVVDGTEIGEGAMIGANSIVSGRIPPNSVVQGNPATVIFTRR